VAVTKRVRIIKKVREAPGEWRFISLHKIQGRYVWDKRPGYYFVEWWQGRKRCRQMAGNTPSEAIEAQRRKRNELVGELIAGGKEIPRAEQDPSATPITEAIQTFMAHVRVHSPHKPKTHQRYQKVLEHFERVLGKKRYIEAITRADIDDYKTARSTQESQQHKGRIITPRTINFEVSVLRTFFYFLIHERALKMENPCARFKSLKDPKTKARRKPPTYKQPELDRIFKHCDHTEKTIFATLLLTGLREQELYFLDWPDVELKAGTIRVTPKSAEGFSPKDYEERAIPIPPDLLALLKELPQTKQVLFPSKKGKRLTHLLRTLKEIAQAAKVPHATLHKFRHTYATRLLESGCDIVTVQKLMGHSDIETTRQYLDPDEALKRQAAQRLTLTQK
jgi:integrase/recombinase XerD